MRRLALPFLTIAAIAALAGCGGGATPTPTASNASLPSVTGSIPPAGSSAAAAACAKAPAGATATVNVTVVDFGFDPKAVQAKVGDIVAWKNTGAASHTATLDDGTCDTGTISPGSVGMLVFSAPGTYKYHCTIHPTQMKDVTVEVK
jgi:plastocyanin